METDRPLTLPLRRTRIQNRIKAFLVHVPYYGEDGQRRLAIDCGASHSSISRLVRGEISPTFHLAETVTLALEKRMGVPLDIREVFTTDGTYPTPCVCDVTPDCHGCFPPEAYDADDNMKPEYRDLKPGDWCRYRPMQTPKSRMVFPQSK